MKKIRPTDPTLPSACQCKHGNFYFVPDWIVYIVGILYFDQGDIISGTKFWWGGSPEPHARAQEDGWHRLLEHFDAFILRTSNCDMSNTSKL